MRRSITSFICGLIGSLFCLFWGFVAGVVGNVGSIIALGAGAPPTGTINIVYILGWIAFIGAILGIVGSALCFKKAGKGGIFLIISTVACGALQVYLFVLYAKGGVMITTGLFVFLLPVILLAVAGIMGLCSKTIEDKNYAYVQQPVPPVEPTKSAAPNSLEAELINLKNMFEKGLITQEEYDSAKKSLIEKHIG